jgi:hypothetical protein
MACSLCVPEIPAITRRFHCDSRARLTTLMCFFNLSLSLHAGFDGGQRQWFIMEIFDQQTNMLQANISSKYPVFIVNGLDSGKLLKIIIYAINVKGRSESVLLEAFTLKAAEKQTGKLSSSLCVYVQKRAGFSFALLAIYLSL